ncbi:MAG TPA: hypothetical protein VHE37_08745 [Nevskiaceae bacterium]|nr:hypothetical protein [Nevskiaceae bacterium]
MTFGVILWQGRALVYRPVPETRGWRANFQGEAMPIEITPELLQAIEADLAKQRAKDRGEA